MCYPYVSTQQEITATSRNKERNCQQCPEMQKLQITMHFIWIERSKRVIVLIFYIWRWLPGSSSPQKESNHRPNKKDGDHYASNTTTSYTRFFLTATGATIWRAITSIRFVMLRTSCRGRPRRWRGGRTRVPRISWCPVIKFEHFFLNLTETFMWRNRDIVTMSLKTAMLTGCC